MVRNNRGSAVIEIFCVLVLLAVALPPAMKAIGALATKTWIEHRLYQGLLATLAGESPSELSQRTREDLKRELPWSEIRSVHFRLETGTQKWRTAIGKILWCFPANESCKDLETDLKEQRFLRL